MIDAIYIAQLDNNIQTAQEKNNTEFQQSGLVHSKVAGKFEIVKELPKKADTFDNMFDYADVYGKIRFAYIDSAHKLSDLPKEEKKASAIGGELGITTASYNDFSLNLSVYISQSLNFINPSIDRTNEDFLNTDKDSFAYVSQASINYENDFFQTKLGRVKVETPYANSDDIRMAPNTFEGGWAKVDYTSELNSQLVYLTKWAGYDSQDEEIGASQDVFKDLVDENSFGMISASLSYEYAKNSEISIWQNYIDKQASITYAEIIGIYFIDGEKLHLDYGVQYSSLNELNNSNVDGDVFGAMSILHYNGAFIGGAYNIAIVDDGEYITDGFGGGPYYTSLDEATISAISQSAKINAQAYRVAGGYEFTQKYLDGGVIELVYGKFYNDCGHIIEKDAIFTYDITDRLYLEAIYTKFSSSCNNNTFDRTLVRLDYSF